MTNVFLITVDDLRADHLGYMGGPDTITPNIDRFAHANIAFTQAVATGPVTTLSFPSILYGLYASEYFPRQQYTRQESIAGVLQRYGYRTVAFNSNPHFKMWGFSKGFAYFEDFLYATHSKRDKTLEKLKRKTVQLVGKESSLIKALWKILSQVSPDITNPCATADTMNEKAGEWLAGGPEQPFLCWMHYMDPHYPFVPPREYMEKHIKKKRILRANRQHKVAENYGESMPEEDRRLLLDLYAGEIRLLDTCIGAFLETLKEMDLYDDSVIIFTADHGELFGDYGRFGHQHDVLYQNQVQVPLIVKPCSDQQRTITWPVSLIDIPHTLMDLLGVDASFFRGGHLWEKKREYVMSEGFKWKAFSSDDATPHDRKCVTSCQKDNWKLIVDDIHGRRELFDLQEDAGETVNVYGEEDITSELSRVIETHRKKTMPSEKSLLSQKIHMLKKAGRI